MKKVKALVVILTVALMAMGIGYAAWSDQINMTATAKTGHLDVTWIDAKVHSGKTYGDLSANTDFKQKFAFTKGEVNGYEYDNVGIYNKNDKVVVTLRDLYPGAHIRVDLTGKNNSTMAVRPESMTVRCISGQSLYEQIGVKAVLDYKDANNVKHSVTIQDSSNKISALPANFEAKAEAGAFDNIVVLPGETFSFGNDEDEEDCFIFVVPANLGNEYMDKECTFEIGINWTTWNNAPTTAQQ